MVFCACESEVETLLKAHLFPATPKQPQLAFTFQLFDWLEVLMLECQIAVQDFVAAFEILTSSKLHQVNFVYSVLVIDLTLLVWIRQKSATFIQSSLIVLKSIGMVFYYTYAVNKIIVCADMLKVGFVVLIF